MAAKPSLVWVRRDFRLEDNPALNAALAQGGPIIPVFIWSPREEGDWPPGEASRWWLHHSLARFDADLRRCGSRLIIRQGEALFTLTQLAQETRAAAVFWNRPWEPAGRERDAAIAPALRTFGQAAASFNAALLFEPGTILTQQGRPFQVSTPFARACFASTPPPEPTPAPERLPAPARWCSSLHLDALELKPRLGWTAGLRATWTPGAAGARANLDMFLGQSAESYADQRNRPDLPGTSCLSPHLHFGEISPRTVWHGVRERFGVCPGQAVPRGPQVFLKELLWREFAHHLLYHFPHLASEPLRPEFAHFPWADDPVGLRAWQQGRTGYPLVDAGMRQLWATGWMHNRVRMVAASFLVKHLRVNWLHGARWFWDTLVDADLANNTFNWQWSAGCGADAAPYFRIFNPTTQAERFDPTGDYIRNWVPEAGRLPPPWIHRPWQAPAEVLAAAGLTLDRHYPRPIVDHAEARTRALEAFAAVTRAVPARPEAVQ
jgi:deoxyribodipyrimidine photo-lyase